MSARRPYVRPMTGWWRKNPFFIEYMIHEGTAFFVAAYALIVLASLMNLANGEAAWNRWLSFLMSPFSIALHVVLLAGFLYHTWTWFHIMPRTLPPIMLGGRRVSAATITLSGLLASLVASLIVFAVITWVAS
ncbi:MAG: hypothetical protein ABL931_04445 [Usitatibacteraceae bacterium]